MFKKITAFTLSTFILCTFILTTSAFAVPSFDTRSFGMGGIGVSTSNALTAVFHNPALIAKDDGGERFNSFMPALDILVPSIGVALYDNDHVIEGALDLVDDIDDFSDSLRNAHQLISTANADLFLREAQNDYNSIRTELNNINAKGTSLQAGAAFAVTVPSKWVSVSPYAQAYIDSFVYADIASGDLLTDVEIATLVTSGGSHNFTSKAALAGIAVGEFGVGVSRAQDLPFGTLYYGVTPKIQMINSINYIVTVDNFDIDVDNLLSDRYVSEFTKFNLDLGLAYTIEIGSVFDIAVGLAAKNIISYDITTRTVDNVQAVYAMKPLITASASISSGLLTVGMDVDITKSSRFESFTGLSNPIDPTLDDYQLLALGAEVDILDWLQVRAGYQIDMLGNLRNQFSAGVGFSPMGLIRIDASASYGGKGQIGAAFQFALTF